MKFLIPSSLFILLSCVSQPAWAQAADPPAAPDDTIVLRAGTFALTKAEYEKLIAGFDRNTGAQATGPSMTSEQSGRDVARLLALVAEAKRRQIDQDPTVQAQLQVRGYVILANTLLIKLVQDTKNDEAGTRALWESEKHQYVEVRARQILVRYKGVKISSAVTSSSPKGASRTEDEAKARAAALLGKLKAGADFATLAETETDDETTAKVGGELSYFQRGQMTGGFETIAFSLPRGGLSESFKTEYGYHIIKVEDHRPLPFDKVRPALENLRARQRWNEIGKSGIELNPSYFKK
jgi:parvulin-like peptidyl-prolyl isomerase